MAKRRLSDKQKKQIQQQQDQHLQNPQRGLVIAHYGDRVDVESAEGAFFTCNLRQSLAPIVVGDRVAFSEGVVLALEPRHSEMSRRSQRGDTKLIAANIDLVCIVIAAEPVRSEEVLDRYLVMTELQQLPSLIIFNKCDLLTSKQLAEKKAFYQLYESIGYRVIFVQQYKAEKQLTPYLKDKTAVFVGLSGVGKSSLLQSVLPEHSLKIGAMLEGGKIGKHTTTTAQLFHLPNGGNVIDSPGIREFSMDGLTQGEIQQGFREFSAYLGQCKFRDCKHTHEPACAIRQAAEAGKISPHRWEIYQKLISPTT